MGFKSILVFVFYLFYDSISFLSCLAFLLIEHLKFLFSLISLEIIYHLVFFVFLSLVFIYILLALPGCLIIIICECVCVVGEENEREREWETEGTVFAKLIVETIWGSAYLGLRKRIHICLCIDIGITSIHF